MDPITRYQFACVAGYGSFDYTDSNNIGLEVPGEGGYFVGLFDTNGDGTSEHALIVSPKISTGSTPTTGSGYWKASSSGYLGTSYRDGAANRVTIGTSSVYQANYICINASYEGHSDYFLPAYQQMLLFLNNLGPSESGVPSIFASGGSQAVSGGVYWTSTEHNSSRAWNVNTSSKSFANMPPKDEGVFNVRAFRQVSI